MTTPSTARFVVFAFVAGFLATLVFNQSAGFVLNKVGIAPPGFTAWALDPVPPWGVPTIVSKAFWGGLWAVLLGLVLRFTRGGAYWASWILLGAVLPSLVGIFIVPPLKGLPIPDFATRFPSGPVSTEPGALEPRSSSGSRARRDANSAHQGFGHDAREPRDWRISVGAWLTASIGTLQV